MVVPEWIVPETFIDSVIPFNPIGVWLYLSFYIYVPYAFFIANKANLEPMSSAFIISGLCSGLIFILFPSTITYPIFKIDNLSSKCLNFVAQFDTYQNCFPSIHGSLITICTIGLLKKSNYKRNFFHLLIAVFMFYSIIQVRRHVFIDLASGIFIGCISYLIACQLIRTNKSKLSSD